MVEPLVGVVVIVVLVGLSAFFSSTEIAVFSLEPHRLDALASSHPGSGPVLDRLRDDPHRLLVTLLVGNNLANIAIASIATSLFLRALPPGSAELTATIVVSVVVLVFGEIVPKSYGVANAESWSLRAARPIALVERILAPLVTVFEAITGGINRVVGGTSEIERPYVSREKLTDLVRTAEREGVLGEDEEAMVQRALRLPELVAGDVMVPRADVVAIDRAAGVETALLTCIDERLTRIVVFDGELDHVLGYADLRDLLVARAEGSSLDSVLSPVLHVFEGRGLDEVLTELQDERIELAVVFDEFGALDGLLTTEDIVEEVVGEIYDVGERSLVVPQSSSSVLARGRATVAEVSDALGLDPTAAGMDPELTMAGLLTDGLGRPAMSGDTARAGPLRVTAHAVEGNRVLRVLVEHVDGDDERRPTGTDAQ